MLANDSTKSAALQCNAAFALYCGLGEGLPTVKPSGRARRVSAVALHRANHLRKAFCRGSIVLGHTGASVEQHESARQRLAGSKKHQPPTIHQTLRSGHGVFQLARPTQILQSAVLLTSLEPPCSSA